jgi:hypothetical protein
MLMTASPAPIIREAETLARRLLSDDSDRLAHCRYAAELAALAVDALGLQDAESIVAAAWLHDIGHASGLARTGFHPLDGALHLASEGWPHATVLLVAHHSHAAVLAPYFGVESQMAVLDHVPGEADDILAFADVRSGPTGMGTMYDQEFDQTRASRARSPLVPDDVWVARYGLLRATANRIAGVLNAHPSASSGRRRLRATSRSGSRLGD